MAQQPPLTPEELKAPPLSGDAFIDLLHRQRAEKYPALPPLYAAMADGSLAREYLKAWIKDLYFYWDNLYQAVGGIFVKINTEDLRSRVLIKLVNIEGRELAEPWSGDTTPAYEELWLRFGVGAGVPRAEVLAWKPFSRTHFAITTLALYSKGYEWTWLDGLASIYAGDLHQRDCMAAAYDALATRYGMPEAALEFFRVYLDDTARDLEWLRADLAFLACTTERQHTAARAFRERLDIENQVVTGVWLARDAEKAGRDLPARVP